MKCPYCRSADTDVYNTRSTRFQTQIWRRRRCLACYKAFTTYERPDLSFLVVVNPKGEKTRYSRSTLFSEVYDAFKGIENQADVIDAVTDTIEAKVLDLRSSLTTAHIRAIVLETLKHYDSNAFLRYLASHSQLASPAQLKRELNKY